jgi:hypothetical protein
VQKHQRTVAENTEPYRNATSRDDRMRPTWS